MNQQAVVFGRRSGAVLAGLGFMAAACTGGSSDAGGAANMAGFGEEFSIVAALDEIPIDVEGATKPMYITGDSPLEVVVSDLDAMSEAAGVKRPVGSDDTEEYGAWLEGLRADSLFPFPVNRMFLGSDPVEVRGELGFGFSDVAAMISVFAVVENMHVYAGEMTPTGLDNEVADGVGTIGEGEDGVADVINRTELRKIGRPLRVAARDGLVLTIESTPIARAWMEPGSPRLSSDANLALAASRLDEVGVLHAALFQGDFGYPADLVDGSPSEPFLSVPFDTLAIGSRVVDGESEMILVYVMESDADAETAAAEIETIIGLARLFDPGPMVSDIMRVKSVEASGRTMIAMIGPGPNPRVDRSYQEDVLGLARTIRPPFAYAS